uniref:Putative toxin-antitoxin system toxin component, PIN family n=1 Tax=Candidatus Kentrum sp. FW TaxID=2126338 RepID=A0A450S7V5_9GAMM|nr:MAG: putative toxin-antitoxin system toxin component, PIN family [Candidatus Kentron sp. FW]
MRIEHRLVIDTNLYVSALLNDKGVPNRLVQYVIDKTILLFSFDTLLELYSVLMRPKFDRYVSPKDRSEHFRLIHQNATLVVLESISYIEAHGTGTRLGDPIEVKALTQAFRLHTRKNGFCAIGSVKTNIGHVDAAAGVAGLIKTVLSLQHHRIPPNLHFKTPNPEIDFAGSPFYVNAALADWETGDGLRRAGVSSFGIGGTNAHVIVEEAPIREPSGTSRDWQLLVLSAKTETALDALTERLTMYLARNPDTNLANVAYTLSEGRKALEYRRMVVCREVGDAKDALKRNGTEDPPNGTRETKSVLMTVGNALRSVPQTPETPRGGTPRRAFPTPEWSSMDGNGNEQETLDQTVTTQPALFVTEYALARLWMSWGVEPEAMIGHSMGEYVAACLATLARRPSDKAAPQVVLSSLRHRENDQSDVEFLLGTLGKLWLFGGKVDWSEFYANERYRLPLPTYPFERQRYWIDPPGTPQSIVRDSLPEVESSVKAEEADAGPRHARSNLMGIAYVAPRNDLEQTIAEVWGKSLGIEQVGIHDDFFQLGGSSLLAVQLIGRLREILKIDLPSHSLLTTPTVMALAESIAKMTDEKPERQLPSNLIEMQAGSRERRPLFLVHPAGGHVYFYRDLIHHLDPERPVYGIQAQETDGKSEPITRVEKMAARYIEIVRTRQPKEPYALGGASFGGIVAFEMARQLHASGEAVPVLVMIDTPGPGHVQAKKKSETDAEILAYFLIMGGNISVTAQELEKLAPDEQLRYFLEEQKKREVELMPDVDMADVRHFLSIFRTNLQMTWDYRPSAYPGKAVFFRAMEKTEFNPTNPERAWVDLVQGGLAVIDVPGNHITMNEPPNVRVIAERLKIYLSVGSEGELI